MKKLLFTLIAVFSAFGASAQIQSTYFLDHYTYSYRHNPANMSESSFVGAVFSNVEAGAGSSLGLSSLFYPAQDGNGLVTCFNSSVSTDEFRSGIKDANTVLGNFDLNLFSLGLRKEKTMTTFELNFRNYMEGEMDGDILRFLKEGTHGKAYDFSSCTFGAKSYIELAIGHSRILGEKFSFGYRVKGLMGVAGVYANLQDSQAMIADSQAGVNVKGQAGIAGSLLQFGTDADGTVNGVERGSGFGPAGFGAAVDAGVNWKPMEGLTLSASVSDLGVVSWKYSSLAEADHSVTYDGFDVSDADVSGVKDELNALKDDVKSLVDLRKSSGEESSADLLPFRFNVSARYQIPHVKSLSAGALVTYQNSVTPIVDARAAVIYTPRDWFSLTGNLGANSFGLVWGGALSLNAPFLNFFLGFDAYAGPVNSELIPVNSFLCKLNLGVVFRFGKSE
jgi:hypothetical protein